MIIAVNCESSQTTLLPTGGSKAWRLSSIHPQRSNAASGFTRGRSLLLHEGAAALVQGAKRLLAGDRRDDLREVPFVLRILVRIHFILIHVSSLLTELMD